MQRWLVPIAGYAGRPEEQRRAAAAGTSLRHPRAALAACPYPAAWSGMKAEEEEEEL